MVGCVAFVTTLLADEDEAFVGGTCVTVDGDGRSDVPIVVIRGGGEAGVDGDVDDCAVFELDLAVWVDLVVDGEAWVDVDIIVLSAVLSVGGAVD